MEDKVITDFNNLRWEVWEKQNFTGKAKAGKYGPKRIRLLKFPPGFKERKWCKVAYQGYVVEGEMEIEFEKETIRCYKNSGFVVPAGNHRLKSLNNKEVILFVIDTP